MLFNSWQFLCLFLPVTACGFFLLPVRVPVLRKMWLCAASFVFYGYYTRECLPLLILSICGNYGVAEAMIRCKSDSSRRALLVFGVGGNLALLAYFKYMNFFLGVAGWLLSSPVSLLPIALPLAISFFTLTQISYLVDVKKDPRVHYGILDYTFFVVFFPHLIAGPIVRHWEIIPQFIGKGWKSSSTDVGLGVALFLMGLYKKVMLADSMAGYANGVFGAAEKGMQVGGVDAWLGTTAFALQIYFDFSGYSDMAIGLARMFGIRFPCNFDSPYRARSIIEFWQRWHMTLTRFLREYIYYPLGGNRRGLTRQVVNVMLVFVLSGLWHGAGWMFLVWGGLHGVFMVVAHQWKRFHEKRGWRCDHVLYNAICVVVTSGCVLFAWVFFRSPTMPVAMEMLSGLSGMRGFTLPANLIDPDGMIGSLLGACGVRFVADVGVIPDLVACCVSVALLVLMVWLFPNTQQILRRYEPVLETEIRPSRFTGLRLNGWTGMALGLFVVWIVHAQFNVAPSPFVYFKF